uniref:NPH3 domain-containing protein n=1 Tax=Salix viminalis TaxID=40686 RepID=A0A6N2MIQ1_SALVM
MAVCCDLEVDVNGEETFMVDKKIIASYCGRLSKLFGKSTGSARNLKVIFNDFPGGAESFELMSRFCYNNGRTVINPSNISLLYSAAQFMEMNISVSGTHNLLEETGKSLEEMKYWTWSELLITTKKCQDLLPFPNSTGILEKCVDSLIGRITASGEPSPCPSTSSPDSSGARLSCDSRSTESLKNSFSRATWWFDDLLFLSTNLVGMVIEPMVSKKFDHVIISRFLFYYQKSKCYTGTSDDKRKVVETVIDMLCILDWNSVSFKSLFGILRVALNCNIRKCSRAKLESMIGSQMDQATLDNLLIPSPHGMNYSYDVNLVLRFLKAFLHGGISLVSPIQLRKVASLMDLYIAEFGNTTLPVSSSTSIFQVLRNLTLPVSSSTSMIPLLSLHSPHPKAFTFPHPFPSSPFHSSPSLRRKVRLVMRQSKTLKICANHLGLSTLSTPGFVSLFRGDADKGSNFLEDDQLSSMNSKIKLQTAEQQRHFLRMLEKSLAREMDLEKKLTESRQLEEELKDRMDQATLDNLLIPSPHGMNYSYNVNLVLRFLKAFLHGGISLVSPIQLRKVASLMDLYIAEVAPDPCLKPYNLPSPLSEQDFSIKKLQSKLSCLSKPSSKDYSKPLTKQNAILIHLLVFVKLGARERIKETSQQIVVYARKLDLPTDNNDKIRAHLKGMQWRVTELERVCMKMQAPMTKIMNSRVSRHSSSRSLPRLCS